MRHVTTITFDAELNANAVALLKAVANACSGAAAKAADKDSMYYTAVLGFGYDYDGNAIKTASAIALGGVAPVVSLSAAVDMVAMSSACADNLFIRLGGNVAACRDEVIERAAKLSSDLDNGLCDIVISGGY